MYERILLPLDASRWSEAMLPYAGQMAAGLGSRISLLHVITVKEASSTNPMVLWEPDNVQIPAHAYMKRMEERLARDGAAVESLVRPGTPAAEIVRTAETQAYNLIAMTTHGRAGLGRWAFGSTTDKVLHSTRVPLLLLRPRESSSIETNSPAIRSLIVPLDGSPLAEQALPAVAHLAARLALPVVLVRAVPSASIIDAALEPHARDPRLIAELVASGEEYLERQAAGLRGKGLNVSWAVKTGDAAAQIIDYADSAPGSMLVMSSHGRGGLGRWVLGSVAERVLRYSYRPVLLHRSQS